MLTLPISYTNFDDEEVTETFYFNVTKTELLELQHSVDGGMDALYNQILQSQNHGELIKHMQSLILIAYGERSEDGRRFIKTPELRENFKQTAAFDALFLKLASDQVFAADFFTGIMPKDFDKFISEQLENAQAQNTELPPPPAA